MSEFLDQQTFEMTDATHASEFTNLSKTCILHALSILSADDGSSSQVNKFCNEIFRAVQRQVPTKTRRRGSIRQAAEVETQLIDDIDPQIVERYIKREISSMQFLVEIERVLFRYVPDNFDHNAMFSVCWKVYRERQRPDSKAAEFSMHHPPEHDDCMYLLWLIFNAIISPEAEAMMIPVKCLDVIMERLFDLCGHECSSEELVYSTMGERLDYPSYLKAVANYSAKFKLKSSLTCEVSYSESDLLIQMSSYPPPPPPPVTSSLCNAHYILYIAVPYIYRPPLNFV